MKAIAAATEHPHYPNSGIAGAWPLVARIALEDWSGAAAAFQRHPWILGQRQSHCKAAQTWLQGLGVPVMANPWSPPPEAGKLVDPWLTGTLLPSPFPPHTNSA